MLRKPLKSSTHVLKSVRECSSSSSFTFSSTSEVICDSGSSSSDEIPDLYFDSGTTSKYGVQVNLNASYSEKEYFPIIERDIQNADYTSFILPSLDAGKTYQEVPFPQMWRNSQDLLRIKLQAGQHWAGTVRVHCKCEEMLPLDSDSETSSTTPDSFIWRSFPKNETTKLLQKVAKKLKKEIKAGVLKECTDPVEPQVELPKNPPPPPDMTKRRVKSLTAFFGRPKSTI